MNKQQWGFGLAYITKQTPKFASHAFRFVLYSAAVVSIIVGVIDEIPADVKFAINKYNIYAVTLVHAISKLFGLPVEKPDYTTNKDL